MRTPRIVVGIVVGIALLVLAVGCSSGDRAATPGSISTTNPRATTTTSVPPKQAAIAYAQGMLDAAVLPSGARRSDRALPELLRSVSQLPAGGNLEERHRVFAVPGNARATARFLKANPPPGFVAQGIGSMSDPANTAYDVVDVTAIKTPNLNRAMLVFGIADGGAGASIVRVDAVVGWTAPRSDDEFVPKEDRVVIVTALHGDRSVARRVVVTDPTVVQQVVHAFNALRVAPPGVVHHCFAIRMTALSYRVAFAASRAARPDIVATFAACTDVGVTVNGKPAASLQDSGFIGAVAHAIGRTDLQLG